MFAAETRAQVHWYSSRELPDGLAGAWLGGLALVEFGNYDTMFVADIVLAALAALINVPIREAHPVAQAACAAR